MKKHKEEKEIVNTGTGEVIPAHLFNQMTVKETQRANGTIRLQYGFENCPTLAEQHTAHLSDLNYLIQRYQPDQLAAYIAARSQYRAEVLGHDFSAEPSLQEAKNLTYRISQEYENLPEEVKLHFTTPLEFLKAMDDPRNQEKLIKLGILTKRQIQKVTDPQNDEQKSKPNDEKQKNSDAKAASN